MFSSILPRRRGLAQPAADGRALGEFAGGVKDARETALVLPSRAQAKWNVVNITTRVRPNAASMKPAIRRT